jgi:hypothetical protein
MNAGKALADMIGNIGQRGIMSYNAQLEEFQLYPAPGQIRSIRAKLPKIVIAQ